MFLKRFFFVVLFFISLVACTVQGDFGPIHPTVEPIGTVNALPIPVDFATLNEDPFFYANRLIQVSGQYIEMAPISCFPVKGPEIRWGLEAVGFQMNVTDFDRMVGLAPSGAQITVDGVWQLYDGPVGCGKEPANGRVWHLEVSKVVSPNPLVFTDNGVSFEPIDDEPTGEVEEPSNNIDDNTNDVETGGIDEAPSLPEATDTPASYIDVVVEPTEDIGFDLTATAVGGSIQDGQTPTPSMTPSPTLPSRDGGGEGGVTTETPETTGVPTRSSGATTETPTPTVTPTPEGEVTVDPEATESGGLGSEGGGQAEQTIIAPTITPTSEPYVYP